MIQYSIPHFTLIIEIKLDSFDAELLDRFGLLLRPDCSGDSFDIDRGTRYEVCQDRATTPNLSVADL